MGVIVEFVNICSISGLNPISNILSASSKTKYLTDLKVTIPFSTKSIRRPGVAVNM